MADQIHVVYSKLTGRIRSIVVPTQVGEPVACNLGEGEAVSHFDLSFVKQPLEALQAALNQQTGLVPSNDLYAMVDVQGNVTKLVLADLAIDAPDAGCQLVAAQVAGPGWTYDKNAKTFTNPKPLGPAPDLTPKPILAQADAGVV